MALDVREVHVVAVHVPVAGLLPQGDVVEDRRLHLAVAAGGVLLAPQVLQLVEHRLAGRLPERRARAQLAEHEQAEVAAEAAVVARAGLLELVQVLLEVVLGVEGGAVDAGEHLALGVAAPVGARHRQQLERLHALGRRRVRAAAEVGERAVGVEADGLDALVSDEVLDQLDLVVLALALEALERGRHRDVLARERLVGLDVLAHLGLERLEVVLGDGDAVGELEVVVEALADRRADRDLGAGIEVEHGGGQHVRGVVADELDRVPVVALGGDDLDALAVVERRREVADPALVVGAAVVPVGAVGVEHPDGERGARQPAADRGGQVGAGGAVFELALGAVGKGHAHRSADASGIRTRSIVRGGRAATPTALDHAAAT